MFSENLSKLRKRNGLTQENLAERLGVSRQAVARWEAGETAPDVNILSAICALFGVSADEMIGSAESPSELKADSVEENDPEKAADAQAASESVKECAMCGEKPREKRHRVLFAVAAAMMAAVIVSNGAMICSVILSRSQQKIPVISEKDRSSGLRSLSYFAGEETNETMGIGKSIKEIEFWNAESFKEWMEEELRYYQSLADEKREGEFITESGAEKRVWDQDTVDKIKESLQKKLECIEAGDLYTKSYEISWEDDGCVYTIEKEDGIAIYSDADETVTSYGFTPDSSAEITTDETVTEAFGSGEAHGKSFEEIFKPFNKFGLKYSSENGERNLYYNGKLVKKFIDVKPDGGTFIFDSSAEGGELIIRSAYSENGELTGIK